MTTLYSLMLAEEQAANKFKVARDQIAYLEEKLMTLRSITSGSSLKDTDVRNCEEALAKLRDEAGAIFNEWTDARHNLAEYISHLNDRMIWPLGGE